MNSTLDTLFNHSSVRNFTPENLTSEEVSNLLKAAQSASTASFQQSYSIIEVTDKDLKDKIAVASFNEKPVKQAPRLFIFCADLLRHKIISDELTKKDVSETLTGIDGILVGTIDASLAAQNMVVAAESMDLGICYIGGIRDAIEEISDLLEIPDYVFPVFGLIVGHPEKRNALKPRLPLDAIYHENTYDMDKTEFIEEYKETTRKYYEQRKGGNKKGDWSDITNDSFYRFPREFMKSYLNDKKMALH